MATKKVGSESLGKKEIARSVSSDSVASHRRELVGVVVSNRMSKTIVVRVDRRVRHGLYGKYLTKAVKYKAHDETNAAKPGDQVRIKESRPLSREKRWALAEIVRIVAQTAEANV